MIASESPENPERGTSLVALSRCEVCGREFDPFAYQIVVPGLGGRSFDGVDCALQARSLLQAQPLRELGPGTSEGGRPPAPHIRSVA